MQRAEHVDELAPEPVLERHPPAVELPRNEHDLLVLDVDALDRPDPLREIEQLRLGERLGRVEASPALPDERRIEALLDRRPDREGRSEVVSLDHEVGAVADPDLVELVEQLVGRMACEDVGEPRLDADADEREQPGRRPLLVRRELEVAEHHARLAVRALRMGLRERRRHVEIRAARLEGRGEDLRIEARIGRVENGVGLDVTQQRDEPGDVRGVDAARGEPAVVEPRDHGRSTGRDRGRRR